MPILGDKLIVVNKSDRYDNRRISTELERNATNLKRLHFDWADKLSYYKAHKHCLPEPKNLVFI